jgi:hypothetical protein
LIIQALVAVGAAPVEEGVSVAWIELDGLVEVLDCLVVETLVTIGAAPVEEGEALVLRRLFMRLYDNGTVTNHKIEIFCRSAVSR